MSSQEPTSSAPRVSIIVPNFNHARFLEARLNSILHQTFADFELIFLDDASTDNSRHVFERFGSDPRVQSHFNDINSGSPFIQWNRGFALARGEYVWIAESDDFCEERFLETLVTALDTNPQAGVAYTQSWVVSQSGEKLHPVDWYSVCGDEDRWNHDFTNRGRDELASYMGILNTIPNASAVLFRRSLLAKGIRAPERMQLCGDWYFWACLLLESDLVYFAKPLNCFRHAHSGSQRHLSAATGKEITETLEVQSLVLRNADLAPRDRWKMLRHLLRRWGSLSSHQQLSREFDRQVHRKVKEVYAFDNSSVLRERLSVLLFFYFVVPGVRTWLYQNSLKKVRTAIYNRKHPNRYAT